MPWLFFLTGGFVCSDESLQNNNRAEFRGSLQAGFGITAETFEEIFAVILLMLPSIVVQLLQATIEGSHLSDAEYIVSKFCAAGYSIVGYFVDKAETHGSLAVR